MDGGNDLKAIPEDDLVVLPRHQSIKGPINKRAFQKRRRSRACDACRLRKTKCDAPPEGTCTSCASASLLCKFTAHEDEKKKIGPARRLRILEATVQELSDKLKAAEAKLQANDQNNDEMHQDIHHPSSSESQSSFSDFRRESISTYKEDDSPPTYATTDPSPGTRSPHLPVSQRKFSYDGTGDEDIFVGSNSGLGFLASVQEYVERLGYDTTSLLGAWKNSEARTYPSSPTVYHEESSVSDLRALLPPKPIGRMLLDIFHHNTTRCLPIFHWPIILNKFERAYEAPIYASDQQSVTGIFCVLMSINAYSSICSDDLEVFEMPNYNHKRGWHFFECVKKYHDLHRPIYSLADAEVLLITSLYLDLATLPSPYWMAVGSLARVCQDLGLHRKPAEGKYSPVELEHRSRIFWCTFLLDRKLALQYGRPPILDEDEIDMVGPGESDTSDLVDQTFEATPSGLNTFSSLVLIQQLIANAKYIDPILKLQLVPGTGQQIEVRMHEIEQKLDVIEKNFPEGILDWDNTGPLDPVLLKYAIVPMATRLSMYRFFTDATLDRGLRTRCFIRSVEVAKSTVHLLERMVKYPDWERGFRLHQSELSYHHTFKVAIILLLAADIFTKLFRVATADELNLCIHVLKAAAPARPTVLQSLQIFDEVSKILKKKQAPRSYDVSMDDSLRAALAESFNTAEYDAANAAGSALSSMANVSIPRVSAPVSTSMMMPSTLSQNSKILKMPPIVPSNDMNMDTGIVPKFWPNYDPSGRPALGFSHLISPAPNENTAWLSQIDPSYWSLMENVLSPEPALNERR